MSDKKDWKYIELWSNKENNSKVKKLITLYEKNPYNARVVFMSNNYHEYSYYQLVAFEDPKSEDFDIVVFKYQFGVSTTNKRFTHRKRMQTLRFREKTGFWLTMGKQIRRPTNFHDFGGYTDNRVITEYLVNKFAWYRCMVENKLEFNKKFTLHKVWGNKLFSLKKLIKEYYSLPIGSARLLHNLKLEGKYSENNFQSLHEIFRTHDKFIIKKENLSLELLNEKIILKDTIRMARKLGKVVNFSWGIKRLREEHDKWSEELTEILFLDDNKKLNIKGAFLEFADFSGYYIIKTTRGLALEGQKQKHCVGGYATSVDNGHCAIFHIKGYTLELGMNQLNGSLGETRYELVNKQFRGFNNEEAPKELMGEVQDVINKFNDKYKKHDCLTKIFYTYSGKEKETYLSEGAHDWEIFDVGDLDENGEPRQILVDERRVNGPDDNDLRLLEDFRGLEVEDIGVEVWNNDYDDLPF